MTRAVIELTRDEALPASLFLIQYGTDPENYFAYTDSDVEITFENITYVPLAIGTADMEASGTLDRKALELDVTPNAEIVRMYAENPPSNKVGLTIRQGHHTDPDEEWLVAWMGVIKNVNWQPPLAKIIAEPIDTMLARPGLRRFYMYGCPHVLYSEGAGRCNASKETHRRTVTPTAIGGNYVDLPPGWNLTTDADKYVGGYLEWTEPNGNRQIRTILDTSGSPNRLLIGNTRTLSAGTVLTIYAGCNRTREDCAALHSNIVNFGGQPWIPTVNPVNYVNRYY